MQRLTLRVAIVMAAFLLLGQDARAELFSKAYAFKPDTTLQVGVEIPGGLRLDTVEFVLPKEGSQAGTFTGPKVKVSISNLGTTPVKIGVAIAVTDAEGRLVAVASGGTKLFPLRTDRQIIYTLAIDNVHAELSSGSVFRISIEPTP